MRYRKEPVFAHRSNLFEVRITRREALRNECQEGKVAVDFLINIVFLAKYSTPNVVPPGLPKTNHICTGRDLPRIWANGFEEHQVNRRKTTYSRHGDIGSLRLAGVLEASDACAVRDAAIKALHDLKADNVEIDCTELQQIDLGSAQVLASLKKDVGQASRGYLVVGALPAVEASLRLCGVVTT